MDTPYWRNQTSIHVLPGTDTAAPVLLGQWNTLKMDVNLDDDTVQVWVNGVGGDSLTTNNLDVAVTRFALRIGDSSGSAFYLDAVPGPTPGLPGDFDGDGDVDGQDFLLWQRDPGVGTLGDWEANYGSVTASAANATGVPEPATLMLLAMGLVGIGMCVARRRVVACSATAAE